MGCALKILFVIFYCSLDFSFTFDSYFHGQPFKLNQSWLFNSRFMFFIVRFLTNNEFYSLVIQVRDILLVTKSKI